MNNKYTIYWIENGTEKELEKVDNLNVITNNTTHNNIIKIYGPAKFSKGCSIDLRGEGTLIEIGSTKYVYNFCVITCSNGKNMRLKIGKDVSMWRDTYFFLNDDNTEIIVGNDCMFSKNVYVYASDGHVILDKNSEQVINPTKGKIKIGDRVWIGTNVTINKDVEIGADSIVGEGSVVCDSYAEGNCILSGNPASITRRNVIWKRNRPHGWEYNNFSVKTGKLINEMTKKKIISIIPARYQSSRFPGKPLALINGKSMIQWVYERVSSVPEIEEVYVATDDQRIFDAIESFGGKAIMTGECVCGSDRVYQACRYLDADIILNIQGDEPMIKTEMIRDLISAFNDPEVKMATLKKEITSESDINNPNIAKLITDENSNAIYFSRSTIPYNRDGRDDIKYYKHIGVYGYTKDFLKTFVSLPQSSLENAEQLEQLRAIENGYKIRVIETQHQSIGVDLPEHIAIVEEEMKREGL